MNTAVTTHYAEGAYDSRHIPNQSPQVHKHAGLLTTTLAWGNTEDIAPFSFVDEYSPERLRDLEEDEQKNPGIRQRNEAIFHNSCNHLCYRRAHVSLWTQIWVYLWSLGKGFFFVGLGILLFIQVPLGKF
ncbi:MAG: hypothetical protein Q7J43_07795 [Pseudomonas sp.]|uniref:hypothetical protein n=1 Tax=Pseudomonas sp. TaxID=306 RepID=UPI00271F2765|nr:hypothetical protein [Pseudomonas sp.]MDO9617573.1 hypothetical protein [Pseudomonas sp.]MDP2444890.1 hypothetical protein [Pseudomonas sp.]MDZ4335004.1 hypothetical protein [Pseudomonas sp.]